MAGLGCSVKGEAMDQTAAIETPGLIKDFKGFRAVDDVNLTVRRGTIHALLGPNGAGKTTCLNHITKFLHPTTGRILFDRQHVTRMAQESVSRLDLDSSLQTSATFTNM